MAFPHGVVILEDPDGLVFMPLSTVALAMDETAGRITVVDSRGEVAHRSGPVHEFGAAGFVEIAPGVFANPRHGRRKRKSGRSKGATLVFPGGWTFPCPSPLPRTRIDEGSDPLVELGEGRAVLASRVLYVGRRGRRAFVRLEGEELPVSNPRALVARHPHLVPAGLYSVNASRLRSITTDGRHHFLRFDSGEQVSMAVTSGSQLAQALSLDDLRHVGPDDPVQRAMYAEGLRDWPTPLMDMQGEALQKAFGQDRRRALANVIWQVVRMRALGQPPDYGHDHRGFWYLPLFPVLQRLGFLCPDDVTAEGLVWSLSPPDALYLQYQRVLADLIGTWRLFTYRDLGFDDGRPDLRAIGATHPHVVLVVEKASLLREARAVAEQFGVSFVVLGGGSTYLAVEFLAEALRPALAPEQLVHAVAYVDFDPSGWQIAETFVRQMARYGIATDRLDHLIQPSCFTRGERSSLAYPLPATTQAQRTLARQWVSRSGGVDGRAFGIHADHLRPLPRVLAAFRNMTGLSLVEEAPSQANSRA